MSDRLAEFPRVVEFVVPGPPVPKARARVVRRKNGKIGSYTPEETLVFEKCVQAVARLARVPCFDGPVGLDVVARWPYPQSWSKPALAEALEREALGLLTLKATKPDLDNIVKAVADALNKLAYRDDGHVAELRTAKCWGPVAETRVRLWQGTAPEWSAWWTDVARTRAQVGGAP